MKTYAIYWKSTVSGQIGTGTKRFEKKEAERLAAELNEDYPDINHEAVIPVPVAAKSAVAEPALASSHCLQTQTSASVTGSPCKIPNL